MGVVTTAIFWGTETAFWVIWHTDLAREAGAVLGPRGGVCRQVPARPALRLHRRGRSQGGVTHPAFRTVELSGWGRYPRRPGPVAAPRDAGRGGEPGGAGRRHRAAATAAPTATAPWGRRRRSTCARLNRMLAFDPETGDAGGRGRRDPRRRDRGVPAARLVPLRDAGDQVREPRRRDRGRRARQEPPPRRLLRQLRRMDRRDGCRRERSRGRAGRTIANSSSGPSAAWG